MGLPGRARPRALSAPPERHPLAVSDRIPIRGSVADKRHKRGGRDSVTLLQETLGGSPTDGFWYTPPMNCHRAHVVKVAHHDREALTLYRGYTKPARGPDAKPEGQGAAAVRQEDGL